MQGSPDGSTVQPLSESLPRVLAKIEAAREAARLREAETPSESSPAKLSPAGRQGQRADLKNARVPDLYLEARWDLVRSPAVKQWADGVAARCRRRSEAAGPPNFGLWGHGLILLGPTGTGKSSAAALVAEAAVEAERTVAWRYVPDLCDILTSNASARQTEIRRLSHVDLLILDDFGVREIADWEVGYLDQIMEARYRSRKPVVITTNLTPVQIREDVRLERMTDRWRERLASNMAILTGASMRTNGERNTA